MLTEIHVTSWDRNVSVDPSEAMWGWLRLTGVPRGHRIEGWEPVEGHPTEWYVPMSDPIWADIAHVEAEAAEGRWVR